MKVLVTGGTGFLGSHLVELLVKKNYSVRCILRKPANPGWLKGLPVEIIGGELSDIDSLDKATDGIDIIFHLAGLVRAKDTSLFYKVNHIGTKNLIEIASKKPIKKFIFISSQSAAGPSLHDKTISGEDVPRPVSHYGKSKLLAEEEVLKYKDKISVTILRPPAIYGPREKDIFSLFKLINCLIMPVLKNFFFNLGFVNDVVEQILIISEKENETGNTYFIGDAKKYEWVEVGNLIARTLNKKPVKLNISKPLASFFTIFNLLSTDKVDEFFSGNWLSSISRAKEKFGISPKYSVEEGIAITTRWYKDNGWL